VTPLHRRMVQDMSIRQFAPHTLEDCLPCCGSRPGGLSALQRRLTSTAVRLAGLLGLSPDRIGRVHRHAHARRFSSVDARAGSSISSS